MLKSLTAITLLLALPGFAQAEDGSSGGDGLQIEFDTSEVALAQATPMSCKEARATAWFIRELKRSDGNTNPELESIPCGNEMVAESTVNAD